MLLMMFVLNVTEDRRYSFRRRPLLIVHHVAALALDDTISAEILSNHTLWESVELLY